MTIKECIKKFIPKFVLNLYHFKWAFLGALFFGFPGFDKKIKIIGVTGTSGKSTTCNLITSIIEEGGYKVASLSTVRFKIGEKEWENKYKMTMPGRWVIQKFLWQAKKAGCNFVVLEVTSQGIEQFRHKFINFDTAVFTNLSPEHIEAHGGFEKYKSEKLKLFKACKNIHVINKDDKNSEDFLKIPAKQKIKFSFIDWEKYNFKLNLIGDFNIMNALSAVAVAKVYGIDLEVCKKALEKVKGVAGRMEVVQEQPFKVVVDYAHTPEQLEAVYKSLISNSKFQISNSPLICVLGSCGGGRDKWKRPVLGQLAEKYCKEIILTNEDPYDENPLLILDEIKSGFSKFEIRNLKFEVVLDRKEAIKKAIKIAKNGDCVIITGKGSEPWMCVENGKKIPWSDKEIVKEALNNK